MESHLGEEENEIVFFDDSAGHEDQGEERSQQSWNIISQVKLTILFLVNFTYDSKSRGFFFFDEWWNCYLKSIHAAVASGHTQKRKRKIVFF
jgi:hypothetical protein